MTIIEGSPQEADLPTGYLTAQEAQLNTNRVVQPDQTTLTKKQSEAMDKLKCLGAELRRFISRAKREHKDEHHSVGL